MRHSAGRQQQDLVTNLLSGSESRLLWMFQIDALACSVVPGLAALTYWDVSEIQVVV